MDVCTIPGKITLIEMFSFCAGLVFRRVTNLRPSHVLEYSRRCSNEVDDLHFISLSSSIDRDVRFTAALAPSYSGYDSWGTTAATLPVATIFPPGTSFFLMK
jgi:hypothetical protein